MRLGAMRLLVVFSEPTDVLGLCLPGNRGVELRRLTPGVCVGNPR